MKRQLIYQIKEVMNTSQIKAVLRLRIESADEKLLRLMYAITAAYNLPSEEEITDQYIMSIPPSPEWKPRKESELLAELQEASAQMERGEYYTLEELEKEMQKW